MPEYLAPGVYVEEVDTGSKPIEGVSTSTTGMVGVTERGPVDVPVLVTGVGEFNRWFGGLLRAGGLRRPPLPAARGRRLLHQRRQARLRHARPRRGRDRRPRRRSSTAVTRRRSRRRSCGRRGRGRVRPAALRRSSCSQSPASPTTTGSGSATAATAGVPPGRRRARGRNGAGVAATCRSSARTRAGENISRVRARPSSASVHARGADAGSGVVVGSRRRSTTADAAALVVGDWLEIGAARAAEYRLAREVLRAVPRRRRLDRPGPARRPARLGGPAGADVVAGSTSRRVRCRTRPSPRQPRRAALCLRRRPPGQLRRRRRPRRRRRRPIREVRRLGELSALPRSGPRRRPPAGTLGRRRCAHCGPHAVGGRRRG